MADTNEPRIEAIAKSKADSKVFLYDGREGLMFEWANSMRIENDAVMIDTSKADWISKLNNATSKNQAALVAVFHHGRSGYQRISKSPNVWLDPNGKEWASIVESVKPGGRVLLMGSPQDYRLNNIGLRAGASINGGSLWQFGHYMRKVLK